MPDSNFFSGPLWLINSLHLLTFTLHLIAMNFVVGGLVVVLWGKLTNRWEHPTVKLFIKLFPSIMAATVSLGVAPLLFLQLVYPKQMYSAAITSGWFWLSIPFTVIVAYYLLYSASFKSKLNGKSAQGKLIAVLVGLVAVSFIYSSVFSLAERPELLAEGYAANQTGWYLNPNIGEYIFRWLHMLFGAVTVGAFFFALIGQKHESAFIAGKRLFVMGTIANSVIGTIYLFQLGDLILPFMRSPGIRWLTVGIIAAFACLHFINKRKMLLTSVLLFIAMLTMVISRHYVRVLSLGETYDPTTIPVDPNWTIITIFLLCFVVAVWAIWYMARLYITDSKTAR